MEEPCVIKILGATATSFAAVDYNENKVAEGVAECVALRNFGPLEQYNFHAADTMKKYLQKIADRNDRVQHPQLHIMVSYPGIPSEEEKAILLQNFKDTLDSLGYKGQPQAIWAHYDTDHFHFHAATVRVDRNTGKWIDNAWEGVKARRILDQLRGIEHDKQLDKMLNYNYTSLNQFQHILRANGYHFNVDEENNNLEVYRACRNVGTVSIDEIKARAEENISKRKTDKEEQLKRLKQVRAVINKYRDKSLSAIVDVPPTVKTKSGKVHTKTATKAKVKRARFQGSSGLDLTELKKAQFKHFLIDLKRTAGLEILFHKGEDGKVKGYSVIDNSKGTIYNGSDVMKLSALLNGKGMTEEIIPADLAEEVNQEFRNERTAKRDKITPSNIYDVVQKKLKEFNFSWREPSFISSDVMSFTTEERTQKAIELISLAETQRANGNWRWEINAEMAAKHAYGAYINDKMQKEIANNNIKESSALHVGHRPQNQAEEHASLVHENNKPKPAVKPMAPKIRPISFSDFAASVSIKDGKYYITSRVGDMSLEKPLLSGHVAWYRQQPNKTEAARGLALHYFSEDLYQAKREIYKKQCISHGHLPYGMILSNVKTGINNIIGRVEYPNLDWDANCIHKYREKDRLPGETDKQMFIRMFGSEEADRYWDCTFKDIKNYLFDNPSDFSEPDAISETLSVFGDIAAAFNDSAAAIIGFALGSDVAYVPSCGGGGGNNNLPKKKDDDDRKHPRGLFSKPMKSKGWRR